MYYMYTFPVSKLKEHPESIIHSINKYLQAMDPAFIC